MRLRILSELVVALGLTALAGCGEISQMTGSTFHAKFGWKAKDYFDDPQVIALCQAIEANDLKEMDRLIAAGANVNLKGKDNMTPLMWAFPDGKLERFTKLLEHGADPNVVLKSDLNTHGHLEKGQSVTHMACATTFPGYFEAVFAHGGDPNLIKNGNFPGDTPLFSVIKFGPNKKQHVRLLIDKGADVNHMNGLWATPVIQAVSWGGQYDLALLLLESGADYRIYVPNNNSKLIHLVLAEEDQRLSWTPQQAADYEKLVEWLEHHGESLEQARADHKRWESYRSLPPAEYRRKMDVEVAEREAREARKNAIMGEQKN